MKKGIIAGAVVLAGLGGIALLNNNNSNIKNFNDKDCVDFETQHEAQLFFEANGGPSKDPHNLDRDKDGIVCESLK